jgi:hypothetical protein
MRKGEEEEEEEEEEALLNLFLNLSMLLGTKEVPNIVTLK